MKIVNYWRMATLIKITGFVLSNLPFWVLEALSIILAEILFIFPNKRNRVILSNLKYAFPDWSHKKILSVGKESAARMFEMGLFSLVYPFLSKDECRRVLLFDQGVEYQLSELRKTNKPALLLVPHVALFECLAVSPHFRPQNEKRLGAIYRPNRNLALDNWIKESRKSINIDVFPRDSALWKSKNYLKDGNWLGLLFDQHSGVQGCHASFLNRFASITTMPDLFAKSTKARVFFTFPRRIGFFKSRLEMIPIKTVGQVSFEAHNRLEEKIRELNGLPEWLWSHARWKTQQNPRYHLMHRHKREYFPEPVPRTTKIWIRMPNWLGDIVMVLPLIDAIYKSRPDADITLLAKSQYEDLFSSLELGYNFISTPSWDSISDIRRFLSYRREYPSIIINFANSFRSDLECFFTGVPARYGLTFPGRFRPLLSHSYSPGKDLFGPRTKVHQTKLWENMLNYFGLREKPTFQALRKYKLPNKIKIGVLPGSSNNSEKRWPVSNWITLIKETLRVSRISKIALYGSEHEIDLSNLIVKDINDPGLVNKCGKTNFEQLCIELSSCSVVVGNDSGGMHLANCLGVPSLVIFGPTNPNATRPIYGTNMSLIRTDFKHSAAELDKVMEALLRILNS